MESQEFKTKVEEILGNSVSFDGHFNKIIPNLSSERINSIFVWIRDCRDGQERPEPCKNHRDQIAFIYKSSDNMLRGILTKQKNDYFIELFLDKHKYYDEKRKYLGI